MCSAIFKGADMFRIFLKNIPSLVLRIHQWSNYRQRKQKRRPHSWLVFPWRTTCWTERGLYLFDKLLRIFPIYTQCWLIAGVSSAHDFLRALVSRSLWFDLILRHSRNVDHSCFCFSTTQFKRFQSLKLFIYSKLLEFQIYCRIWAHHLLYRWWVS